MTVFILSFFLIFSPLSLDAAPVVEQGQLSAESVQDAQTESEDHPEENVQDAQTDTEADPDLLDQEDSSDDLKEADSDPVDQEDPSDDFGEADPDPADQEDLPANSKLEKEVIKEYQHITIYQSESVQADPVASDDLDYIEESYYLLSMICAILLFFLVVCVCKYIYRFFDIFV